MQISLNRDKIAKMGLNIPSVGTAIQLAFRGNDQSKFKDKGEEYNINIMYDKGDRKDLKISKIQPFKHHKAQRFV